MVSSRGYLCDFCECLDSRTYKSNSEFFFAPTKVAFLILTPLDLFDGLIKIFSLISSIEPVLCQFEKTNKKTMRFKKI